MLVERLVWMTGLPLPQDLSGVREILADLRRDPGPGQLGRLRQALQAASFPGPTASPQANAVLDLALSAVQGDSVEDYSRQVLALDREVAALTAGLAALGEAGASERFREVARQAATQAEALRAALAGLDEAVAAGSQADLEAWGQALSLALNRTAGLYRELVRLLALEGRTPCIRCGCLNASHRTLCEQCGAILPAAAVRPQGVLDVRVGEEDSGEPTRMTENLARILEACERFYAGVLDSQGFLQEVTWLEGLLEDARRLGLGGGAQDFEEGLALLRQAGEREDRALVEAGRRRLWEGTGKLQASA